MAEGKEDEARIKFNKCVKNGSYYCARKSAEELTTIGNIQEKNNACKELLKTYSDNDAKLIAARQFKQADESGIILSITENLDFENTDNELIKIRMEVLHNKQTQNYKNEVFNWFTSKSISELHYSFYRDFFENGKEEDELEPKEYAIKYRIDLYKRNYTVAFEKAFCILSYFDNGTLSVNPQLVSDIGKSFLYGNSDYASNAKILSSYAEKFSDTDSAFYFWFYAGRLFDKAGLYGKQATLCFEKAISSTKDSSKKDNALWYLIQSKLNQSVDETVNTIGNYAKQWSDPEYFDDFFESLSQNLLINCKWDAFKKILDQIDGYATNETVAQYSYIYGRLLQNGLISENDFPSTTKDAYNKNESFENIILKEQTKAFKRALNSGNSMYYRILAAYQLKLSGNDLKTVLQTYSNTDVNCRKDFIKDDALEILLKGYASYGFPEKIYSEWLKNYKTSVSTDTSFYLADFLQKCGNSNEDFQQQSIRMANRAASICERQLSKEEFRLVYPKYFSNFVDIYCKKYDINTSVIYALIRSESFFDANIISSAGAIGLTQLMEFTGNDIARKLRKQDYSLTDPETNIEFGTFYLSELVKRCNDSYLPALLSYNAGITRVRRWQSSSINEFSNKNMNVDLFVETVPYEETRGYGKKLLAATVMYEWLYNENCSFESIVQSFFK